MVDGYIFQSYHTKMAANVSEEILTKKREVLPLQLFTSVIGFSIFFINCLLFGFLIKVLFSSRTNKDMHSILVYTIFVCINDMLAGFAVFLFGCIPVYEEVSARACLYTGFISFALQLVSQGNIACISIQRYRATRHITSSVQRKSSSEIKLLLFVNISIAAVGLCSFFVMSPMRGPPYPAYGYCSLTELIAKEAANTLVLYFVFGVFLTISADVFAVCTIFRLRKEFNIVIQPQQALGSSGTSHLDTTNSERSTTSEIECRLKTRQRKATFTIFMIILFFNLTLLPTVFVYLLIFAGVHLNAVVRRIGYISTFFNSIVNPFIIAIRVETVKQSLENAFVKIKNYLVSMFC